MSPKAAIGALYTRAGRTHPSTPRVEVGGQGVERIDVVDVAGVFDVLSGHHPRLDGGEHLHQQLGKLHFACLWLFVVFGSFISQQNAF